jgi:hypothetical protein
MLQGAVVLRGFHLVICYSVQLDCEHCGLVVCYSVQLDCEHCGLVVCYTAQWDCQHCGLVVRYTAQWGCKDCGLVIHLKALLKCQSEKKICLPKQNFDMVDICRLDQTAAAVPHRKVSCIISCVLPCRVHSQHIALTPTS